MNNIVFSLAEAKNIYFSKLDLKNSVEKIQRFKKQILIQLIILK